MDSITARFREIFKRGLYEYATIELHKNVTEDDAVEVLQSALQDNEYIFKETVDPPLFMAIALTEALEDSDEDRVLVRQKGYEIYQNLRRDHSVDHRIKIVKGILPLRDLVAIDSKELAPDSVKRRRKEEERKYLKEQVIIQAESASPQSLRGTLSEDFSASNGNLADSQSFHTPPTVCETSREKLPVVGKMPSEELALDLVEAWSHSAWPEMSKFSAGLPVPSPLAAFTEPTLDRIRRRLEWLEAKQSLPSEILG